MLAEGDLVSPSHSDTLLRRLLVGIDPARVRSFSELADAKFCLRRTSSLSASSRSSLALQEPVKPRRFTLSVRPRHQNGGCKRSRTLSEAPTVSPFRSCSCGVDPSPDTHRQCLDLSSRQLGLQREASRLASQAGAGFNFGDSLWHLLHSFISNSSTLTAQSVSRLSELFGLWASQLRMNEARAEPGNPAASDIISPLSQLLESTPSHLPVPGRCGLDASPCLSNCLELLERSSRCQGSLDCSCQKDKALAIDCRQEGHQILDLSSSALKGDSLPDGQLHLFGSKEDLCMNRAEDVLGTKRTNLTSVLDWLRLSRYVQTDMSSSLCMGHDPLSYPPCLWPVRLVSKNSDLLRRRVLQFLVEADEYTFRQCQGIPARALLAAATSYRYCKCQFSDLDLTNGSALRIPVPPDATGTLGRVLHRIWPRLLITYMIKEDLSFTVVPLSVRESEDFMLDLGPEPKTAGRPELRDLHITRLGTAHSLLNLIRTGNQLHLEPDIMEGIRKCILAQCAYPNYFSVSHRIAMDNLRHSDPALFGRLLLLLNEINALSPEGLHCLFSIGHLVNATNSVT